MAKLKISLSTLLLTPMLGLLALLSLLVWGVMQGAREQTTEALFDEVVDRVNAQIVTHLKEYLESAQHVLDPLAAGLTEGSLDSHDTETLLTRMYLLEQLHPEVTTLGFAHTDGHYIGYSHVTQPPLYLDGNRLHEVTPDGRFGRLVDDQIQFDARTRPWYRAALDGDRWSRVYRWELNSQQPNSAQLRAPLDHQLGLSALRTVYHRGELIGVLENVLTLDEISAFLAKLDLDEGWRVFIYDSDGYLVADSQHTPLLHTTPEGSLERVLVRQTGDPQIDLIFGHLQHADRNHKPQDDPNFVYQGETYHTRSSRLTLGEWLQWHLVVSFPEKRFAHTLQLGDRTTLLLVLLSLVVVGLLGTLLTRRLLAPIEQLAKTANTLSTGTWPQESPPSSHIREVRALEESFFQMAARLRDQFGEMNAEMTQRSDALAQSQRTLSTLLGNIPGAAYRCLNDDHWSMLYLSQGCEALTGYRPEELTHNQLISYEALIVDEDRNYVRLGVQEALERHQSYQLTYRIRHRDNSVRWIWEQGHAVYGEEGRLLELEGLLSDVTALKQAEAQLRAAKREAELANLAKSRFLANMSHEIRTPMQAILGFSELLLAREQDPCARREAEGIRTSSLALMSLIEDVLDLSRIEANKLELDEQAVVLPKLVEELKHLFSPQSVSQGVQLDFQLLGELPTLRLDGQRLRQILINLLSNAIKFAPEGEVECAFEVQSVGRVAGAYTLEVRVCDNGIGIPASEHARIFEPFEQVAGPEQVKAGGTGLGLSIARGLATRMGGTLTLANRLHGGSCFTLTLPLVSEVTVHAPQTVNLGPVPEFRAAHILIADDLPLNRLVLEAFLKGLPFSVEQAEDGWGVLDAVRRQRPDLILMDIRMPRLNGLETTRILRSDPAFAAIPIVAITAGAMRTEREAISAECDAYLAKPVKRDRLLETLSHFLGSAPADAPDEEPRPAR